MGVPNIDVGHGPSIDAVRAGSTCTDRQAQNHCAHRILRPLPNLRGACGQACRPAGNAGV